MCVCMPSASNKLDASIPWVQTKTLQAPKENKELLAFHVSSSFTHLPSWRNFKQQAFWRDPNFIIQRQQGMHLQKMINSKASQLHIYRFSKMPRILCIWNAIQSCNLQLSIWNMLESTLLTTSQCFNLSKHNAIEIQQRTYKCTILIENMSVVPDINRQLNIEKHNQNQYKPNYQPNMRTFRIIQRVIDSILTQ